LQGVTAKVASAEEKEWLLLGSLVVISTCLPTIYGIWKRPVGGKKVIIPDKVSIDSRPDVIDQKEPYITEAGVAEMR
jgi:hypothetical protein